MIVLNDKIFFYSGSNPSCKIARFYVGIFLFECLNAGIEHNSPLQYDIFRNNIEFYLPDKGKLIMKEAQNHTSTKFVDVDKVDIVEFAIEPDKIGKIKVGFHKSNNTIMLLEWMGVNQVENNELKKKQNKKLLTGVNNQEL